MKGNDILSHLENIVFSMGQSAVTSINLIVESIEMMNVESLFLIENLEKDLDEQHQSIDQICFDIFRKNKLDKGQIKKILIYLKMAEQLERIGDICNNISHHLRNIIANENEISDIQKLIDFSKNVRSILSNGIKAFIEQDISYAKEVHNSKFDLIKHYKELNKVITGRIEDNNNVVYLAIEIILINRNLVRIARLGKNISESTIFLLGGDNYEHLDENEFLEGFFNEQFN